MHVTLARRAATPTAVIAAATTWDAFPSLWPALLEEVWASMRTAGAAAGRNVMLYRDDVPHVEVGVELPPPFAGDGRIVPSELPAGTVASTFATGAPRLDAIAGAHAAVRSWCAAEGHELEGTRWEIYDHWRDDQDPGGYRTEICWLVRAPSAR